MKNIFGWIARNGTSFVLFMLAYAFIFESMTLLRILIFSFATSQGQYLLSMVTPPLSNGLQFNLLGSFLPVVVSIYLLIKSKAIKINIGSIEIFFLICYIIITIISVFFPLTPVDKLGAHGNIYYLGLSLVMLFYYVKIEKFQFAMLLAYISGTLVGILNDITATLGPSHFIGIFGGLSIFDLDFVFPLSLFFAVWVMAKINNSLKDMYTKHNHLFGTDE